MGFFKLPETRFKQQVQSKNWFEDPWGETKQAVENTIINPIGEGLEAIADNLNPLFGQERQSQVQAQQQAEPGKKKKEEDSARTAAYNQAIAGNLDTATRQQIEALYSSGASASDISKVLAEAKEGKGIYFVRRNNELRRALATQQPGREQTVFSLGQKAVLGGGRGGY